MTAPTTVDFRGDTQPAPRNVPPALADGRRQASDAGRRRLPARGVVLAVGSVWAAQAAVTVWRLVGAAAGPQGARNIEATYHALLTATALRGLPLPQTLGLPVVTLRGAGNAGYPWGSAVPNQFGQFVYTSFPPGGFWLLALVTALPTSAFVAVLVLNGVLGALTGTLLLAVARRAIAGTAHAGMALPAAALTGLAYVLSGEALQSHGPVYWPHSALQPVLAAQILVLLRILDQGSSNRSLAVLAGLTAVGGYVEWTEYVFAFTAGALLLLVPALRCRAGRAALVMVVTGAATAVVLFLHFTRRLGVDASIAAWTQRADARSNAPLLDLVDGLGLSVGGTALALLLVALAGTVLGLRGAAPRRWLVVVALAAIPCLENLLLRQHATVFTFDRLKDALPLCLALGFAVALLARRRVLVGVLALACGAVLSFSLQLRDEHRYAAWHGIDSVNRSLLAQADAAVPFRCARIGTSANVRGYLNLVTGRSIREWTNADLVAQSAQGDGGCGSVFIQESTAFTDLPSIDWVTTRTPSGETRTFARPSR